MSNIDSDAPPPLVSLGAGKDLTVAELAKLIGKLFAATGEPIFGSNKSDGTIELSTNKLDSGGMRQLVWRACGERGWHQLQRFSADRQAVRLPIELAP